MATCPKKNLIEEVTEKALSPQEVQVAGMGASKEQRLDHQLEFLKTMCATRAGRGAGIPAHAYPGFQPHRTAVSIPAAL